MKHRTGKLAAGALALALVLTACAGDSGAENSRKITAEEGKALMDAGGVVVVDVRRVEEYTAGHVPGALHIPNEDIGTDQPAELPDLDATIILYCRTGVRSGQATAKLVKAGYTNLLDMGGFVDWTYDTVTGREPGVYAAEEKREEDMPDDGSAMAADGTEAPGILSAFTATDLAGEGRDQSMLADYDLTMVNVWGTFCRPCLNEMPDLGELAAEYAPQGVQIVGLVSDTLASDGSLDQAQVELAREIVTQTGADYPHLLPSADLNSLLSQIYYLPTTFFVDSQGRQVGEVYTGARDKAAWAAILEDALEEVAL